MKSLRSIPALCAFFVVAALIVAGCGSSSSSSSSSGAGSVPATDAAVVAGNPITKRAVLHWMYVDAKGEAAQDPGSPVIVPTDPPEFPKCIAQVKKQIPTLAKESDAKIRDGLPERVHLVFAGGHGLPDHRLLVSGDGAQAGDQPDPRRSCRQAITKAKTASGIKTAAAYKTFLSTSGLHRGRHRVPDPDLDDLHASCSSSTRPPSRTPRSPVTTPRTSPATAPPRSSTCGSCWPRPQANANAAKAALQSGQSWDTVAKKYSIDPTTKDTGGLLKGITAKEEDAALSKAAFAAPLNKLAGPGQGPVRLLRVRGPVEDPGHAADARAGDARRSRRR